MPNPHDLLRLAAEAGCSDRTAKRWYENPARSSSTTRFRLVRAAAKLRLPLPESMQCSPGTSPTSPSESKAA